MSMSMSSTIARAQRLERSSEVNGKARVSEKTFRLIRTLPWIIIFLKKNVDYTNCFNVFFR